MNFFETMSRPNRRQVFKTAGGLFAALNLPRVALADGEPVGEPHFFMHIYLAQGVDSTSLFDARPLGFTQAGRIHNYFGVEPTEWVGGNGLKTLVRSTTDILRPYKDDFSVINGVVMNTTFDGHDQNALTMMSGNPFGGAWFLPDLAGGKTPLDYLLFGRFPYTGSLTNSSLGLASTTVGIASLVKALGNRNPNGAPEDAVIGKGLTAASGTGLFARGSAKMSAGLKSSQELIRLMKQVQPAGTESNTENDVKTMIEFLRLGLTTQVFYAPNLDLNLILNSSVNIDCHDEASAKAIPTIYPKLTQIIADAFKTLKSIEFSPGKSFLDVTTIVVNSEFTRSMRQVTKAIDNTGTDHNPLGNSVLMGGKGIKKGCVFGATDLDVLTSDGSFEGVSAYHKGFDSELVKMMGKPIDFATGLPLMDSLTDYDPAKFLTFSNIGNTLMDMFNVAPERHWDMGRNLPKAQLLPFLKS
jgi:Protein of unknown function (DUF1501)